MIQAFSGAAQFFSSVIRGRLTLQKFRKVLCRNGYEHTRASTQFSFIGWLVGLVSEYLAEISNLVTLADKHWQRLLIEINPLAAKQLGTRALSA